MDFISTMREAAFKAGKFLLGSKAGKDATQKSTVNDFVTVADIKSQDLLREYLTQAFPDATIVSEEDAPEAQSKLSSPNFTGFVLDPIDGTYNFKRNMQESAISIGYIKNGQPIAGVIYDPYKKELFEAEAGKGAKCNGTSISVSAQQTLEGASIATSNGYDYAAAVRNLERQVAIYDQTKIMPWTSCTGSSVLVFAWIAAGRIDAIHHTGFKPWDNAAGILIVREAGGFVHTLQGQEAVFTDSAILAASPTVGRALEEVFAKLSPKQLT